MSDVALSVRDIYKSFGNVEVLKGTSVEVKTGTIHALVGENGAGKSTLIKIVTGVYTKDCGDVFINNEKGHLDLMREKIAFVPQELTLFSQLTIAENIYIDEEPLTDSKKFIDFSKMNNMAKELLHELNVEVAPETILSELSVANQQMVQIARAIARKFDILILDEPTAAITVIETQKLFEIVKTLRSKGKSIVYITHKLDEVQEICDDITILRDGISIGTWSVSEISRDEIVRQMAGGKLVKYKSPDRKADSGKILMEAKAISGYGFYDISFQLRKGEILGMAGLVGSGRTETAEAIYGGTKIICGELFVNNIRVNNKTPTDGIKNGIIYLTEERKTKGIFPNLSVIENIMIPIIKNYKNGLFVSENKLEIESAKLVAQYNVKAPSIKEEMCHLSGGNQQKALLARVVAMNPRVVILDEPTRGIDVNARAEIYDKIDELVSIGIGIIVISSEMEELQKITDRILVFHEGTVSKEIKTSEASNENLLRYAMGFNDEEEDAHEMQNNN
ncbi:MAG: sugar ABC transporter ATP-binding protein [Spirochaetales bacterium]|nr:sugar ABC transporter ATP-binding protein [Spirochaetales bacterium]